MLQYSVRSSEKIKSAEFIAQPMAASSWQQVLSKDDSTGAIDIKIDPANPSNLYASMWHANRTAWSLTSGGESSGLYKSTDGGTTWNSAFA